MSEQRASRSLTLWRALILLAVAITLVAFAQVWYPGMVLEFFRGGHPFERLVIALFVLVVFPPMVERFGLPGVIGLILGGVLFGPHVLGIAPQDSEVATLFSEIGRVFLMFVVGLEINLADFRKKMFASGVFGVLTFAVPLAAGTAVGLHFGYGLTSSVLIGSLLASHTLLGLPTLEKLGLTNTRFALTAIGATIFTDIAALLVLAVCVSVHISGAFSPDMLLKLVASLTVYCVLVLGAIPWLGRWYLRRHPNDETAQFQFVMLALVVSALGAELIQLEDIVGAFLCGIAINNVLGHESAAKHKLEFIGKAIFIPVFFMIVGVKLNLPAFAESLTTALPLVLMIVGALVGGKLVAAFLAGWINRYQSNESLGMWSLSLPQLAATLAAALTAFQTLNPAGERLIDEAVLSAVFVLMITTAIAGPILTQRYASRVSRAGTDTQAGQTP